MSHLEPIHFIDRVTGEELVEKVYGEKALALLYGDDVVSKVLGPLLIHSLVKVPLFSRLYGWWQRQRWTKGKIAPFVERFEVDASEFESGVEEYTSFDDFFTRKLKPDARPIAPGNDVAIIPADGRYYFYQDLDAVDGYCVKGKKFSLGALLHDEEFAAHYAHGSMMIARLCPTDYHRFHFPCDGVSEATTLVDGWLYSVNPVAIKKNVDIFTENRRVITEMDTEAFGRVVIVEVGATNVGSIHQTYTAGLPVKKGDEKGYFAFGGSSIIVVFEQGRIVFDEDLVAASSQHIEIRCLMGLSMGQACTTRP